MTAEFMIILIAKMTFLSFSKPLQNRVGGGKGKTLGRRDSFFSLVSTTRTEEVTYFPNHLFFDDCIFFDPHHNKTMNLFLHYLGYQSEELKGEQYYRQSCIIIIIIISRQITNHRFADRQKKPDPLSDGQIGFHQLSSI